MINKYFFNFLIELALFVQIVLWAILGATIIVPIIYRGNYFDISNYIKNFRNLKIKE